MTVRIRIKSPGRPFGWAFVGEGDTLEINSIGRWKLVLADTITVEELDALPIGAVVVWRSTKTHEGNQLNDPEPQRRVATRTGVSGWAMTGIAGYKQPEEVARRINAERLGWEVLA